MTGLDLAYRHPDLWLAFKSFSVPQAGKEESFALGTVFLHMDYTKYKRRPGLPFTVFVHPQAKDLVLLRSVIDVLADGLSYQGTNLDCELGETPKRFSARSTILSYKISNDHVASEGVPGTDFLPGRVSFSNGFVKEFIKHHSVKPSRFKRLQIAEQAQGVVGYDVLEKHGFHPTVKMGETVVLFTKRR